MAFDRINTFVNENPNQPLPKELLEDLDQCVVRANAAGVGLSPWLRSIVDQVKKDYGHIAGRSLATA